ncbi:BIG1-domain-containing protein [Polyplosphaeria fusca]|uniref:Protein BIG1 n=1 Tax=Polyplosphaeria fusca TaxID=682080 RepID=A0A9P4QTC8_9PLEO|nr:BIG1-domain-containing protein [Polyplosphaeria fusca]
MTRIALSVLALALLPSALAFRNTSPFYLFSTTSHSLAGRSSEIEKSDALLDDLKNVLADCATRNYIVVRQEGVSSTDYSDERAAPFLRTFYYRLFEQYSYSMDVSEVVGIVEAAPLAKQLSSQCNAQHVQLDLLRAHALAYSSTDHQTNAVLETGDFPQVNKDAAQVVEITFPSPGMVDRTDNLAAFDAHLNKIVDAYTDSDDYTILYTTTPREPDIEATYKHAEGYEMENPFGDSVQMELKRDVTFHKRAPINKTPGLFEKYQFFNPGIFAGLVAFVPLFLILTFGLKSIASLEVSYFAFSKEMGPAAQRKQ